MNQSFVMTEDYVRKYIENYTLLFANKQLERNLLNAGLKSNDKVTMERNTTQALMKKINAMNQISMDGIEETETMTACVEEVESIAQSVVKILRKDNESNTPIMVDVCHFLRDRAYCPRSMS